jgi:hypothetical protein
MCTIYHEERRVAHQIKKKTSQVTKRNEKLGSELVLDTLGRRACLMRAKNRPKTADATVCLFGETLVHSD